MRFFLKRSFKLFLLSFLFCNSVYAFFSDVTLPVIHGVKKIVDRSSVGFEWPSLARYPNVMGVNVYRAKARPGINQVYVKIATVANRFATHFVDTNIEPGTKYFYTFTTYSGLNESAHGDIISVLTKPPYKAVKVISATLIAKDTVKLLWIPSSEATVYKYVIERKKDNSKWFYLTTIKGRLYPEYIDATAFRGHRYSYRIIAKDAYGVSSYVSNVVSVRVQ